MAWSISGFEILELVFLPVGTEIIKNFGSFWLILFENLTNFKWVSIKFNQIHKKNAKKGKFRARCELASGRGGGEITEISNRNFKPDPYTHEDSCNVIGDTWTNLC